MRLSRRARSTGNIIALLFVTVLVIIPLLNSAHSQSGRQSPDPKKQRPVPPRLPEPPPIRDPQQPAQKGGDETIRISSDLVTVVTTVSLSAKDGKTRADLQQEDFEITEDGVRQEIANFARDADLPLRLVMLFDTSLSVSQKIDFERRAAAKFFQRVMRAQDSAALFMVSSEVTVLQDFTNRIPLLVSAALQLKSEGATSLYDGIYLASDYLKPTHGRKIIIIVSDGGDTTSNKGLQDALANAQKADAVIFSVFTGNRYYYSQNLRDLAGERALETLTAETGGDIYKPRATPGALGEEVDQEALKELDIAFADLAQQLRTQYTLGFYSSNEKRDGSFRKLSVKIKKPGYVARARAGYYAPKS
ncbi:MAG: VWA domain-containing protein [Blastocatellia bacterium]|nr:VWA domain-containing protein [Blastocatellia bacterium]